MNYLLVENLNLLLRILVDKLNNLLRLFSGEILKTEVDPDSPLGNQITASKVTLATCCLVLLPRKQVAHQSRPLFFLFFLPLAYVVASFPSIIRFTIGRSLAPVSLRF